MAQGINRLKLVLAENRRTNKWWQKKWENSLATVSKWCSNVSQPPMETFVKIAKLLEVDINELVRFERKSQ